MTKRPLTPDALALVADRFKVLSEPARLQILNCLRKRELTVSEIVEQTGLGQANVSKHLQLLLSQGSSRGARTASSSTTRWPITACSSCAISCATASMRHSRSKRRQLAS